ncbi:hypothetical protein Nepgr_000839 [Nepenthes gracilis]|uniref:Uncharacterized protein n=1 Tax=Nepenthes gracilis TaxID=150966 RepID=A0AAD3RX79_NEPGR|nr:hypothetical protein Nepgr_000839 [Nepenthes gracilis]
MPRPGPRPYQCVRRAWHSERHQPIRGSLIQEIFRIANEIHSAATKKNKQWQEKLPIVVLKAEEIMYSKANSEAEYMDPRTLWSRVNDAINVIIRRDETTETGDFLQPCIEAALNLGCIARRASRSQRNSNPSSYLSASPSDSAAALPTYLMDANNGNPNMGTLLSSKYSSILTVGENSENLEKELSCITTRFSLLSNKFCPVLGSNFLTSAASFPSESHHPVFPLYYGIYPQIPEKQLEAECDLSLRLGPLSAPCTSFQSKQPQYAEDVGLNGSRKLARSNEADKGFPMLLLPN